MKINPVLAGVLAFVLLCGGVLAGVLGIGYYNSIQMENRVSEMNTAVDNYNPVGFAQAPGCGSEFDLLPGNDEYVYGYIYPGMTMLGDIEIQLGGQWVKLYDEGGVGQFNTLRNPTDLTLEIRGKWGAGCLYGVDQYTMVMGEFDNPNHFDIVEVRDVEIQPDGTIVTTYFDEDFNVIRK